MKGAVGGAIVDCVERQLVDDPIGDDVGRDTWNAEVDGDPVGFADAGSARIQLVAGVLIGRGGDVGEPSALRGALRTALTRSGPAKPYVRVTTPYWSCNGRRRCCSMWWIAAKVASTLGLFVDNPTRTPNMDDVES